MEGNRCKCGALQHFGGEIGWYCDRGLKCPVASPWAAWRPSWDEWGLNLAKAVATRADCSRAKHGVVILRPDHTVVSVGYNGHWRGGPSCLAGDCPRGLMTQGQCPSLSSYDTGDPAHRCESLHAESNAITSARESLIGYTMYVTGEPCPGCVRTSRAARLEKLVWPSGERILP